VTGSGALRKVAAFDKFGSFLFHERRAVIFGKF
jgi:hypothetical protein